jgi:cyclophilin family peptidyl-prolyl cis-trans isomerase
MLAAVMFVSSLLHGGAEAIDPRIDSISVVARTGLLPGGGEPSQWLARMHADPDLALASAWAAWSTGIPLATGRSPELVEFGAGEPAGRDVEDIEAPVAARALLRHVLHSFAAGAPVTDVPQVLDDLLEDKASSLPDAMLRLALQVYGRLGLSRDFWPARCSVPGSSGIYVSWLRYLAETGSDGVGSLPANLWVNARVYAARSADEALLSQLASDPCWAVRFEVAARAPDEHLPGFLTDPVPYVAYEAALRLKEAGNEIWRPAMESIARVDGPVGDMAAAELDSSSRELLMELLASPRPARRLAAAQSWLAGGMAVDSAMAAALLSDPYYIVPLSYLEFLSTTDSSGAQEAAAAMLGAWSDSTGSTDLRDGLMAFLGLEPARAPLPFDPARVDVPASMTISTDAGDFTVELWPDVAPVTCASFVWLASRGFYDGICFHRVIPGFVAQGGCPEGNGLGGPGYVLPNERSLAEFSRGVLGMADAGLDTGGSQFFMMLDDHNRLDCRYTAFGRVTGGLERLDEITVGTRILSVR